MKGATASPNIRTSIEAEQALLGMMFCDASTIQRVRPFLKPEHFSEPIHARLYGAFQEEFDAGAPMAPMSIASRFYADQAMQELGGPNYVAMLAAHAPPTENAADYGKAIFDSACRSDIAAICAEGLKAATEGSEDAFSIASGTRHRLELLEADSAIEDGSFREAPDVADEAIAAMQDKATHGRTRGLMTGLRCFDRRMNGLKPGNVIVIGGRPGMGKSGLARAGAHGGAVRNPDSLFLFLNLEMEGVEIMQRELSSLCYELGESIPYRNMDAGNLTAFDFTMIRQARDRVPRNLILDDKCSRLSVEDVRRKVWGLTRRGKVGAVFIDYLQLMRRPPAEGRNEASVIAEMTRGLKLIATEMKVCIVVLSQLSRGVENRDGKKPQLSDLKESGSIEADADAVLFPFRPYYYHLKDEPPKTDLRKYQDWEIEGEAIKTRLEVMCAKQRGGPEGTDLQRYRAECDHIEDGHE